MTVTGSGKDRGQGGCLDLLIVDRTFGTEELSAYSKHIEEVERDPCLLIHPEEASIAGVGDRERVTLLLDGGPLEVEVHVEEAMARGIIILPRHRKLGWQKLKGWPAKVGTGQIRNSSQKD